MFEKIDGFAVHTYIDSGIIDCFDKQISDVVIMEISFKETMRYGKTAFDVFKEQHFLTFG